MRDDWGWSDPGTLLDVPSPLLRRTARCWPLAGLLVGGQVAPSSSHTWEPRMWSAIAGAQGTGACSRLSPPVPGPHGGRGRNPYASLAGTCRTRRVQLGVGSRHPRPQVYDAHGHIGACWCTTSVHRTGRQRTRWTFRKGGRMQEGGTSTPCT